MADQEDIHRVFLDVIDLGQPAIVLVPDIVDWLAERKVFIDGFRDLLADAIASIGSQTLLNAAQDAGIRFKGEQQITLLRAGFQESERGLLDLLWSFNDTVSLGSDYSVVLAAVAASSKLPETLNSLRALEASIKERLTKALKASDAGLLDETLGEKTFHEIYPSIQKTNSLAHFHACLAQTIESLTKCSLHGENSMLSNDAAGDREVEVSEIKRMIALGEGQRLEFIPTLRFDIEEMAVSERLEWEALRVLVSFSNSEGGSLLIGVQDDGTIIGLDADFETFRKPNRAPAKDRFALHLGKLLNEVFGLPFPGKISFHKTGGREICELSVDPGQRPLFFRAMEGAASAGAGDDSNDRHLKCAEVKQTKRFYVRKHRASIAIENHEELVAYVLQRFKSVESN